MPEGPDETQQALIPRLKVYRVTAVSDLGPLNPDLNGESMELLLREALDMAKAGRLVFSPIIAETDDPDKKYLAVIAPDDGESGLRGDSTQT
jgi:hypothetical protein